MQHVHELYICVHELYICVFGTYVGNLHIYIYVC
jgi:hypothetical protein